MGSPKELCEYHESTLIAELIRRACVQAENKCDYCGRLRSTNSCRFTEHHMIKEMTPIMKFFFKLSQGGT